MADQFDRASELEELERASSLVLHQKNAVPPPKATGECLYCGEPVSDGLRWCDKDCRDDWEHEQKLLKLKG